MATFLVIARVSIHDEDSAGADQQKVGLALPVRDRLSAIRTLQHQLKSISALTLNDPGKGLRTPIKVLGVPKLNYQGVACRPEASNDYYRPLSSTIGCLTADITAEYASCQAQDGKSMQVYVRALSDQQTSVVCTPGTTVQHFKSKLEEATSEGLPASMQFLTYGGRLLEDSRTLSSYNISHGATVHMSARLRGGASFNSVKFVDVSNPVAMSRIPWSTNAPHWRGAAPGLCIEGTCNNTACEAYGQMVIHNAGYTHFDLVYEVASKRCKCPMCREAITPVTCAFNRCEWKYAGVKMSEATGRPLEVSVPTWKAAGDYYERFTHVASNQVTWTRLMLVARDSRKKFIPIEGPPLSSTNSEAEECVICCEEVASRYGAEVIHTPCGHCFHKHCLKPWMQLGSRSCPHCMKDISGLERHLS